MRIAPAIALALACAGAGCAGARRAQPVEPSALTTLEAPRFADAARKHNERAERLGRLWARTVFGVNYTDDEGKLRREQFEGHLQLAQPVRMALSGGKSITSTLFWLGCDPERFWWLELGERSIAHVARHENIGSPCAHDIDLPARPREIISLLGVTTIDESARGRCGWSTNGQWMVIDAPTPDGAIHLFVDPRTYEPGWIKLIDRAGRTIVFSELLNYDNVSVRDAQAATPPRLATRVIIRRPGDEGEIRLNFAGMSDGADRDGRLQPEAFQFEALVNRFNPGRIVVLDADCPSPAYSVAPASSADQEAPQ